MSPADPLPPKESNLFKRLLRSYESKQYKTGLKFAKQILGTRPDHGETLAMKGLLLNGLGQREQAYIEVKKGLKNNLTSHVTWHVFGLLQRSDHRYEEAIKAYRNALKWDPQNIQILRDLSLLQIQMRDLEGYRNTRHQLFLLRPTQRASWIGFAMSYHLLNDHEMAAKILEEFRRTTEAQHKGQQQGQTPSRSLVDSYEHSELVLYQVMVLKEAGRDQEAYDHLCKFESEVCDKLAVHETKAELLLKLGRNREAYEVIKKHLLARNPENGLYYKQLEQSLDLDTNDQEKRYQLYVEYQSLYPRAQTPLRLPLDFVHDASLFQTLIDAYLKRGLRKGQPALFCDLKSIYAAELNRPNYHYFPTQRRPSRISPDQPLPRKIQIIQDRVLGYVHNLEKNGNIDGEDLGQGELEAPSTILWCYYFLAQHYDYLGDYDEALKWVQIAMDHTPTLIELYVIKGKIHKHQGDMDAAVECMDEAQSLDTADRYLNSKCAKYLLRANRVADAEEMCSKFTREGVSAAENLNEMQCMWYEIEAAQAYHRSEQYGDALKKCIEIDRHFAEINEDQFDFHTYCMRKMTLRAYVGLLRLEDILKSHRFYFAAARIAILIYLRLYDKPLGPKSKMHNDDLSSTNLTPSELRKLKTKERKAAQKKQNGSDHHKGGGGGKDHTANKENQNQSESNKNATNAGSDLPNMEKLIPSKLERPEDPLSEAIKFLTPLQTLARDLIETHLLAFEVYLRKNKPLLMLQSLKRTYNLLNNPDSIKAASINNKFAAVDVAYSRAVFNRQLIHFCQVCSSQRDSLPEAVNQVIDSELTKIPEYAGNVLNDSHPAGSYLCLACVTHETVLKNYENSDNVH